MDGSRLETNRRRFIGGASAAVLGLRYGTVAAQDSTASAYRRWEDVQRNKWTWDRVARGTHGTNCTGNCAFNVYVRNGIVWREEQQGAARHQNIHRALERILRDRRRFHDVCSRLRRRIRSG